VILASRLKQLLAHITYQHLVERQALRAGYVASSLVLGGRRVE
jgi:hypothetical protein